MWALVFGIVNGVGNDVWWLIGRKTIAFCRTYGMGRLKILSQYIINDTTHLGPRRCDPRCRVNGVRLPVRIAGAKQKLDPRKKRSDPVLARVFQLRRLYQLFGCSPATWEEMVTIERADEGVDVSMARSGMSPLLMHDGLRSRLPLGLARATYIHACRYELRVCDKRD